VPKVERSLFFSVWREQIKEVVLGARCTVTAEDVYRAFGTGYRGFTILRAKPDLKELKMNIEPEEIKPNSNWFWKS
jgi:hypothetical protein